MAEIQKYLREDFIRIVNGKSLSEAIDIIQTMHKSVNRYPVTVFKSVLDKKTIDSIDIVKYLSDNPSIKVIEERVVVVGTNIHEICPTNNSEDKRKALIDTKDTEFLERIDESDNEYGLRLFTKYFKDTKDEQYLTLYARDSLIPPDGKQRLNFAKSTLNVKTKGNLQGINSPMWYISGLGSGTVFHNEDGDQPSINLCLNGKPKIYAFILHEFCDILGEKLHPTLGRKCALYHKPGIIVNPELLREWEIPVQFYSQKPGDLIYIGEAVLHCVINNGLMIAEAINFGTHSSVTRSSISMCKCKKIGRITVEKILQKPLENEIVPASKKRTYKCDFENCTAGRILYTKKELVRHNIDMHGLKPVKCIAENCTKEYMRTTEMRLHYQKCHTKNVDDRTHKNANKSKPKICQFCSEPYLNLKRHVEEMHTENTSVTCDKCGLQMSTKRSLIRHLEKCIGELKCHCGKVCKTLKGLSRHRKTHN